MAISRCLLRISNDLVWKSGSEMLSRQGFQVPESFPFMIKMGFSSKTIDNVIYAYQETLKFIKEEEASVLVELKRSKSLPKGLGPTCFIEDNSCSDLISIDVTHPPSLEPCGEMLSYRIAADCSARIQFDGPVTQEAIKKLIALLELNADFFQKTRRNF